MSNTNHSDRCGILNWWKPSFRSTVAAYKAASSGFIEQRRRQSAPTCTDASASTEAMLVCGGSRWYWLGCRPSTIMRRRSPFFSTKNSPT
eukprot:580403-Pyramimonas_sp.AAC.1